MTHELFNELADIVRAPFFDGGHVASPAKGSGDPLTLAHLLGTGHVAEITTTTDQWDGVTYLSIFADDVEIAKIHILHPEIVECGACADDDDIEHCSPKCEPEIQEGYELETDTPSWSHNTGASWFRAKWN